MIPFRSSGRRKFDNSLLLMILPLFMIVVLISYLPLFGWIYSFFKYQPGLSLAKTEFVGLKYFIAIFALGNDSVNAIKNTLIFSFLNLLVTPFPILFAILLSEIKSRKFSRIVQTATSLPNFISWVLVYSVFFTFLSNDGFVNTLLINTGIITEPKNALGDENNVYALQTLIGIWKSMGWNAIIYIAAISGIDTELYNSAEIDGAGRLGKILHITIPGILNTYMVLLLLAIGGMMNTGFEQYYVFSNPLVASRIEVLDTYVYKIGLGQAQYAFATAVGMFKSVVSILLLFSVNFFSKKVRGESII